MAARSCAATRDPEQRAAGGVDQRDVPALVDDDDEVVGLLDN
jgi:hypothetical protein